MNAMTVVSLIGPIATDRNGGLLHHRDNAGGLIPGWLSADDYERRQPAEIGLHLSHDWSWSLGRVRYLERCGPELLAVAVATVDPSEPWFPAPHRDLSSMQRTWDPAGLPELLEADRWYFSSGVHIDHVPGAPGHYQRARIFELSLVPESAACGLRPIRWRRGDIADDSGQPSDLPGPWRSVWANAHEAISSAPRYRRAEYLEIVGERHARPAQRSSAALRPAPRTDRTAAAMAVGGYSWLGPDGQRRHVRSGGHVASWTGGPVF